MGKAKKGRKVDHEEDVDGTVSGEAEGAADEEIATKAKTKKEKKVKEPVVESESEDDQHQGKKKKKKEKKSKGSEDVDETAAELEEMSISSKSKKEKKKGKAAVHVVSDDESPAIEKPASKPSKKKGKKKAGGSDSESEGEEVRPTEAKAGFALLALSDGEPADDKEESQEDSEGEVVSTKKETKDAKKEKGGKKSKKKRKEENEEDLEQILAELELEYSGVAPSQKEEPKEPEVQEVKEEEGKKSKKSKKKDEKKDEKKDIPPKEEAGDHLPGSDAEDEEETKGMKTAAQKKKEKKEREKQKRLAEKAKTSQQPAPVQQPTSERSSETPEPEVKEIKEEEKPAADQVEDKDDDMDDDDKKKKKKKKGKEDKDKDKLKGVPNKKTIAAMQEALRKIKEEEDKMAAEEAERIKREEAAERAKQEQARLEQERKERKKAKEKERKERLKAEGKLLSSKQKQGRARAEAMIEAMKAMYGNAAASPSPAAAKPKPFTKLKKKKAQEGNEIENHTEAVNEEQQEAPQEATNNVEVEIVDAKTETKEEIELEGVKDSWDAESSGDEAEKSEEIIKPKEEESPPPPSPRKVHASPTVKDAKTKSKDKEKEESDSEAETSESEESDSGSESESDEEEERGKTDAEKKKERALARIRQRHEDAEKNKTLDELRAAVVCVLGHVDTGKTKILDKLRRTNVQDGEAGGITQQIGATNVPIDAIQEQGRFVKGFSSMELKIPGLLIIDTPGHESFSNLRSRGSSLCDIAILVVDIMHGLEPQTIESLNLLKQRKTPFVVALNKIDRLYDWQTMSKRDVRDILKGQAPNTQLEFEQRVNDVVVQFAEQGLNAALFYNNPDVRSYVSLVPTSAITGEGMGNLLAYIVESCQTMLAKRLMFSEELQATVLEVKAISGLGTTIDVILVNGRLREGDTVVLAGTEAPIVTQIRSLLMPQPLKELRVKNAYVEHKEVKAAQGVKIAAKDLEKVIAGLNLRVAYKPDEVEILREEVGRELKSALSAIKLQERGVYVQASTLGSLEALLEFLKASKIPYSGIRIGPVVKKDVMKASTMLEHDSQYATILAFDVKIERDAQELADSLGVKIFQADIIYHLFDKFMAYREELKQKKRDEFKNIAVFPCKLRILPQFIFNSRDPIVIGVIVEAGIVKEGTPICVPSKEFVDIGVVTGIESNHKPVESARKGQEVCIKIEPIPGEAPKMFGRHFDEKDFLISKISRQSIDACKDYFRDDLVKTDWQLMVELKKLFQIL